MCAAAVLLSSSAAAAAQSTLIITVNGNPTMPVVNTAAAGTNPVGVTNGSTTYTITVALKGNLKKKQIKITGQLNQAMPAGTTLTVTLAAPAGGTSLGPVSLTTAPQDLVNGIASANALTQGISYQLSATAAAGVVALSSRTVTFSMVSY